MSEHESIEQAVRRAERVTGGSIAMMIEAGIKAGLAEKAEHKSHDVVTKHQCTAPSATCWADPDCPVYSSHGHVQ